MRCAGYCGDPAGSIERIRGHPSELEWHQCRKHPQPLPECLSAGRSGRTERYDGNAVWKEVGYGIVGYQSSTVLDEPEREAGTTSIPIPQREESENIPLPDLPGQLENVQQSGNEIAERGMQT